jgi:putative membrane protein
MSRTTMLAVGLTAAMAFGAAQAQAQTNNSNTMSPPAMNNSSGNAAGMAHKASKADQHFLTEAMQGDMAEVEMGKLAQQNGQSEDVKQFGQMLQTDHGQHLQQAQQMAQQMGVTPPTAPSAKQKAMHDKLAKEQGAKFDKAFAKAMVKDHKEDIAKYQKEAKSKGPLAQFAEQTVPVLQKHLQTAQSIESKGAMTGAKSGAK